MREELYFVGGVFLELSWVAFRLSPFEKFGNN